MGKKGLHKHLRLYLSKLKNVPTLHLPNSPHPAAGAAGWLLSACKYPKTPSFADNRENPAAPGPAATLADVDRFLFENFHSLYIRDDDDEVADSDDTSSVSPRYSGAPSTDAIRSSGRFFVSLGRSNSLVDEAETSAASVSSSITTPSKSCSRRPTDDGKPVPGGAVAVVTFSKEPYDDFRRSMQDMVEARHVDPGQPLDWDFMEELLFCYLELNERSVHKHILKAFTDLTFSFRRRLRAAGRKVPASNGRRRRRKKPGDRPEEVVRRHLPAID